MRDIFCLAVRKLSCLAFFFFLISFILLKNKIRYNGLQIKKNHDVHDLFKMYFVPPLNCDYLPECRIIAICYLAREHYWCSFGFVYSYNYNHVITQHTYTSCMDSRECQRLNAIETHSVCTVCIPHLDRKLIIPSLAIKIFHLFISRLGFSFIFV